MENNELVSSPELEHLKAEYSVLKNKFSQQEVINDRLIRETMKLRVRSINSITVISSLCAVIVIILSPFVFHFNPVVKASWAFVAATAVMMLTCIFFNWKYNHGMNDANLSNCDLKEFAKKVQYTRNKWHNWIKASFPMIIIWFIWLGIETWMHSDQKGTVIGLIGGMAIGGLTGGLVGFRMNRKVVDHCDEILKQIDS